MKNNWIKLRPYCRSLFKRRCLKDPVVFCRRGLGFDVQPFQQRWLGFQARARRTMILAPRGHGKTTMCTVGFSLWKIACWSDCRILIVSATSFQSEGFLRQIRSQIESFPEVAHLFGMKPSRPWTSVEIAVKRKRLAKEPTVTARGVGAAIIGRHYDMIICDDVVDRDNSATPESRNRLWEWFAAVLLPCLEPGGELHLVGTRWHDEDLYGQIIKLRSGV